MNSETKYLRNNIEFRVSSSKALGHFKNCQAFMLNELVSGNHSFSSVSRDVALLYYDTWFKSSLSIEHVLLRTKLPEGKCNILSLRTNVCREAILVVSNIFSKYPDIFTPDYVRVFSAITRQYLEVSDRLSQETIETCSDKSSIFTSLVDIDIEYLSSIMYIIHEMDILFDVINAKCYDYEVGGTDKLFLCVNYSSLHHFKHTGEYMEIERLHRYVEELGDIKLSCLTIKTYIPVSLLGPGVDRLSPSGAYVLDLADEIRKQFNIDDICFE